MPTFLRWCWLRAVLAHAAHHDDAGAFYGVDDGFEGSECQVALPSEQKVVRVHRIHRGLRKPRKEGALRTYVQLYKLVLLRSTWVCETVA